MQEATWTVLLFKPECHESGRLVLVFGMPPLVEFLERQALVGGRIEKIREVVYERLNFSPFLALLEIGFGPLILLEGVQLGNEKNSAANQRAGRF